MIEITRTLMPKRKQAKRSSLFTRLSRWLRHPGAIFKGKANKGTPALANLGKAAQRTPAEWKQIRSATRASVRGLLEAQKPIPAIKKLTPALLEDPEFQPYHDLLQKAAAQRHLRRLKPAQSDPWNNMPKDLREEMVRLEAFKLYVNELETILDQSGIPKPPSHTKASHQGQNQHKR